VANRDAQLSESLGSSVQQRAQKNQRELRQATQQAYGGKAGPATLDNTTKMAEKGQLPLPANVRLVDAGTLGPHNIGPWVCASTNWRRVCVQHWAWATWSFCCAKRAYAA